MSGPAKVALSLRHAMRRWLISLPARSKRSAGFLSSQALPSGKVRPAKVALSLRHAMRRWLICRLALIARSDLPASFPSQALPSGKDVRTCQGRAVFATRNAAMAHLSAGSLEAICRLPFRHCHLERAKVALSLRHAMRRWLICRLALIARSDLPASFPSQALPSGKDVRTCQGRAVFATRNAAMAHLSAGSLEAICRLPFRHCHLERAKVALSLRHAMRRWLICRLALIARSDLPASFPSQALPSGKDVRTCQGRAVFATRNAAMAHLSAGSLEAICRLPFQALPSGKVSGPAKVALSLRHAMRRWLICRLALIARSDLPASFPSQALPSGKDVRTCQGRAVFATRNAAMAHLSAGSLEAICRLPFRHCHLERAKVALSLRHAMRRWLICRLALIARSDLPASFPSQALPSGKDVRTCQGRAVFATRNAAMAHLSAGSLEAICRLPFHQALPSGKGQGRAVFATRNAAMAHMPAGFDRSKRSAGFLSIPGIAIWKGCPDLPRSRCLCDTQCGDGSSLCRLARSDLPASFPALPSGKGQGRAVFATRNAAMAHMPAGFDRSKRSAGFLSIPGIAIWKGCPDLPRSRCLCDTQCGDGSSLCRLARSDLPASFPALPSGKGQGRAVFATRNAAMAHMPAGI